MRNPHMTLIGYLFCAAIAVCMSISFYFTSEAISLWRVAQCRYEEPVTIERSGIPFKGTFE